jgi:hypothetical protein
MHRDLTNNLKSCGIKLFSRTGAYINGEVMYLVIVRIREVLGREYFERDPTVSSVHLYGGHRRRILENLMHVLTSANKLKLIIVKTD